MTIDQKRNDPRRARRSGRLENSLPGWKNTSMRAFIRVTGIVTPYAAKLKRTTGFFTWLAFTNRGLRA